MNKKNTFSTVFVLFFLLVNVAPSISQVAIPVTGHEAGLYQPIGRSTYSLNQLIANVANDKAADQVVGLFQSNNIEAAVVQQPAGQPAYVSTNDDQVTQFNLASQYGTTALLAHNYLEGQAFFNITTGDDLVVVYGDGHTQTYQVSEIKQYQALNPTNPYSKFVDLADNSTLTSTDLFNAIYTTDGRLVLQTCISKDGQSSWGRLFVIAEPAVSGNAIAMN